MSDYYCPNCGADLEAQLGFDSEAGYWTCTECGQFLSNPDDSSDELRRYDGVGWFCDSCGAFLNKQDGFSDWYSTWTCSECGYSNTLSSDRIYDSERAYQEHHNGIEHYCPNCNAVLEEQTDFNPDAGYWTCKECGQFLIDSDDGSDELRCYDGVGWFCDSCGAFLNKQDGFSDWNSTWTCSECGYVNTISEEVIQDSNLSYHNYDDRTEDNDDEDDEWEYDNPNRCENCNSLLNKQDGYYDWLGAFECEKCGYYNEWSENDSEKPEGGHRSSTKCKTHEESTFSSTKPIDNNRTPEKSEKAQQEENREKEEKQRLEEERLARGKQLEVERLERKQQRIARRRQLWRTLTLKKQTVGISSDQCRQLHYEQVASILEKQGFFNIYLSSIEDFPYSKIDKDGLVEKVEINGCTKFSLIDRFLYSAEIIIFFHIVKRVSPPITSKKAEKKDSDEIVQMFSHAGFRNIRKEPIPDLEKKWFVKKNPVESVMINGNVNYHHKDQFRPDVLVVIKYHTFKK